jgi:thiamine biosynthesis protein ThiS
MDQEGTLSIRVNGEHRRVRAGLSLSELALELGLEPTKVAVERNLEIVPRSDARPGQGGRWRRARDRHLRGRRLNWTISGKSPAAASARG